MVCLPPYFVPSSSHIIYSSEHEIIELKSENERLQEELTKYQHTPDRQDAETQTSEK